MTDIVWLAVGVVVGIIVGVGVVIAAAILICSYKVRSHREWDE